MRKALLRVLVCGPIVGAALVAAAAPVTAATMTTNTKPDKVTWVWGGPQQHPFATAHPDFQYVASNTGQPAETLISIPAASLPTSADALQSVILDVPASSSTQDGYYSTPVDSGGGQGATPAIQACAVTHTWAVDPPGRPKEAELTWNCQLYIWMGQQKTVNGTTHWIFDLTGLAQSWLVGQIANNGVVLMPVSTSTGAWSVPLSAKTAVVSVAVSESSSGAGTPSGAVEPPSTAVLPSSAPVPAPPPAAVTVPVPGDVSVPAPVTAPVVAPTPAATPVAAAAPIAVSRNIPPGAWAFLAVLVALLLLAGRYVRAGLLSPSRSDVEPI